MNTKAVFSCIRIQLTLDLIAWYDKQANQWWIKFICTSVGRFVYLLFLNALNLTALFCTAI
jgi:hypothetical protein